MRILPTICVHMWRVRYVSCHSCNGSGGQRSESLILFKSRRYARAGATGVILSTS